MLGFCRNTERHGLLINRMSTSGKTADTLHDVERAEDRFVISSKVVVKLYNNVVFYMC